MPLTERLAAIRERAEKATPGPWEVDRIGSGMEYYRYENGNKVHYPAYGIINESGKSVDCLGNDECSAFMETDAAFIARARTDVPALLDALEIAVKALEKAIRDGERRITPFGAMTAQGVSYLTAEAEDAQVTLRAIEERLK